MKSALCFWSSDHFYSATMSIPNSWARKGSQEIPRSIYKITLNGLPLVHRKNYKTTRGHYLMILPQLKKNIPKIKLNRKKVSLRLSFHLQIQHN